MPWYRVWTDILDSEKFAELDDATIGGWTLILSAVKRHDSDGYLPPLKRLAHWTRRTSSTVNGWTKDLVRAGLLEETPQGIRVHDWDHWQEPKDRTNAARQAKFKAKRRNSPSGLPHAEAEQIQRESRQDKTVTAAPLPAGDNGSVTVLPPALPLSDSSRSGEDADQFKAAVVLLSGSLQTEGVAMELSRRSDLPEISKIEGWRWLNAARVMGKGAKAYSVEWLLGVARKTTREEFEAYGKPQPNGNGKHRAQPAENQPIGAQNLPPNLNDFEAKEADNLRKLAEIEARKGTDGRSIQAL